MTSLPSGDHTWITSGRWKHWRCFLDPQILQIRKFTQPIEKPNHNIFHRQRPNQHSFLLLSQLYSLSHTPALLAVTMNSSHCRSSCSQHSLFIFFCRCFLFLERRLLLPTGAASAHALPLAVHNYLRFQSGHCCKPVTRASILFSCPRKPGAGRSFQDKHTVYTWISTKINLLFFGMSG